MERNIYVSPMIEIIKIEAEQSIFSSSYTGEDINEWEDM
jgi:hypothetical protein